MAPQPSEIVQSGKAESQPYLDLDLHQGPLPHAHDFAAYNKVLPGAAHRILKMAEREQKAVIRLRWADWLAQFVSMLLGKGFLYALVVAAVYLAINGKPLEAFLAGLAPIVAAIYANTRKEDVAQDDRQGSDHE